MHKLEVIGFTIESCLAAQKAGAHRIELCDGPGEGGTTPSYGFIKAAREKLTIDLFVMIRPRGGDFLYNDLEFEMMKSDVLLCKQLGCDGIVTGILTRDGKIDIPRNKELLQLAAPLRATFHRAFDRVANPAEALEDIIDLGFERVLTSGGVPKALDGAQNLAKLIMQSDGRIIIMPGSGVNASNILELANSTGAIEFHSSASSPQESRMDYINEDMSENLTTVIANESNIENMISELKKLQYKF